MAHAASVSPSAASRIECAQVYGGTQRTQMPIELLGLDGFLYSRPCGSAVGGDIHYLSICGSGILARFCLADVVGHGADVSIVSEETHSLLRRAVNWTDHRRVLRELNRALTAKGLDSLTTAAMFTYYPPSRSLTFSYAGHPPAWLWSSRRRAWSALTVPDTGRATNASDIPLAVAEDTEYSRGRVRTDPGDVIVVTTDGVSDALDTESRRFGEEGLRETLESIRQPEPQRVVEAIVERLRDFCAVDEFDHDDVSVLALRTRGVTRLDAIRSLLTNRLVRPWRGRGAGVKET